MFCSVSEKTWFLKFLQLKLWMNNYGSQCFKAKHFQCRMSWSSKNGFSVLKCCSFTSSADLQPCDEIAIPWAMQRSNGVYGESSQWSLHGIWHLTRPLGPNKFAMYLHETDIMYGMYQAGRDTKKWFIRTLVTHLTLYDLNMILDIRVRLYQKSKTHLRQH